ncbi:hypothetical protein ENSA5_40660 [Enhygromyxa salina]|uniref:7(1) septoil knot domain-containing protein n=1 Tax=Enhygromyxa salina TaxID=215803 RepID=A0A2S9XPG2_9BACT|nr:hypothetical protein [Enhygromyxa salina]PRP94743.1 hypothetical protein ENSA5_40660 [Enhygromyxa salina]
MSFARTGAFVGLVGLGVWLTTTAPASAGQTNFLGSTVEALAPAALAPAAPIAAGSTQGTGNVGADCAFRGTVLAGKVKVVDSFPDIRVKAVSSFPDLKVKKVGSFADDCGEWQFVDSFADFKIQYVDSFPDIEVAWVDSFPGLP